MDNNPDEDVAPVNVATSSQSSTQQTLRPILNVGDILHDAITRQARARITTKLEIQLDGKFFPDLISATQHAIGHGAFDPGLILRYWLYAPSSGSMRPLLYRHYAPPQGRRAGNQTITAMEIKSVGDGIHLVRCPGLRARSLDGTLFVQDMNKDIEVLQSRGITCLVSAVEPHEFIHLGLPGDFNQLLDRVGIKHLLLPIQQSQVLSPELLSLWQKILARLQEHVEQHQAIAIHSGADLGRAGYVVAKMLIAGGMSVKEAIQAVRAAFPYAIDSYVQENELMQNAGVY